MEDQYQQKSVGEITTMLARLARQILRINDEHIGPLEVHGIAAQNQIDELKIQLPIILGNVNGICERLERLEQAHADLVLQYHGAIYQRLEQIERHVVNILTNTLPASTDRISQLEHQVKDHVQGEIDRLESRLNKLNEQGERLERLCRRIEVSDR